jgi:hypothetical protein
VLAGARSVDPPLQAVNTREQMARRYCISPRVGNPG